MVDIASLDRAAKGAFSSCHNYVKNTDHLGRLYSSTLHTLDHYLIKGAAEPALSKAPEWVSDNRIVTAIQNHQGISLAVGAALTLISFVSFVIWLHPTGKTVKLKDTGTTPPSPKTKVQKEDGIKKTTGTTPPPSTAKREKGGVEGDEDFIAFDPDLDEEEASRSDGEADGSAMAGEKTRSEESNATASGAEDDDEESDATIPTSAKKNLEPLLKAAGKTSSSIPMPAEPSAPPVGGAKISSDPDL
jgi:hypothetical protein